MTIIVGIIIASICARIVKNIDFRARSTGFRSKLCCLSYLCNRGTDPFIYFIGLLQRSKNIICKALSTEPDPQ